MTNLNLQYKPMSLYSWQLLIAKLIEQHDANTMLSINQPVQTGSSGPR